MVENYEQYVENLKRHAPDVAPKLREEFPALLENARLLQSSMYDQFVKERALRAAAQDMVNGRVKSVSIVYEPAWEHAGSDHTLTISVVDS